MAWPKTIQRTTLQLQVGLAGEDELRHVGHEAEDELVVHPDVGSEAVVWTSV